MFWNLKYFCHFSKKIWGTFLKRKYVGALINTFIDKFGRSKIHSINFFCTFVKLEGMKPMKYINSNSILHHLSSLGEIYPPRSASLYSQTDHLNAPPRSFIAYEVVC